MGIPSEVGVVKTLTIAPDELRVFEPFTLQAVCRWFRQGDLDITCTRRFRNNPYRRAQLGTASGFVGINGNDFAKLMHMSEVN